MREVTHCQHQKDYQAGWDDAKDFIKSSGINAAKSRWNLENPHGENPSSLGAYYYACGGLDALID